MTRESESITYRDEWAHGRESRFRILPDLKRLQRRRTRGWRMPEGAVYVGRPSRWGNPHISDVLAAKYAVAAYAADLAQHEARDPVAFAAWLAPLRGHDLACYCELDEPCHADVLLELANR